MARIAVIEDEADLRKVLEYNLRQAGHEVLSSGSGREGLRLVCDQKPDLLLLDLMLPDISGIEICRTLKENAATRSVVVVILTARGEEIDRVVQSRGALLDHVWGMDTKISTRTVDAHVKRLREKLGAARDYVQTVRGVGYRFAESPEAAACTTADGLPAAPPDAD